MEGKKIKWQGSPGMSQFGKAGPPIQHSESIITMDELRELIKREDIKPDKLFSKEEILADPKVKEKIEQLIKADEEKRKKEEDDMIPDDKPKTLTPEEKKKQEEDNKLIPDGKGEPGENDLIPD